MAVNGDLTVVCIDNEDVPLHVRRNAQAKRLILRVDRNTAEVRVTAPPRTSARSIRSFVAQHLEWVQQERQKVSTPQAIKSGMTIPYIGAMHTLVYTDQSPRRVAVEDARIIIGGPEDQAPARLERWLRDQARHMLSDDARHYAGELGVSFARLSIGDMKTRWGSCSSHKTLKFNWRLIMAPSDVRRYVAAHEVSHLLEMNHSERFWKHVGTCMPDYSVHRRWLKKQGDDLMMIRLRA